MEKYTMFMDRKNQYSENEYTTQSNLQIQCNPCQATSHIFHRTGLTFLSCLNFISSFHLSQFCRSTNQPVLLVVCCVETYSDFQIYAQLVKEAGEWGRNKPGLESDGLGKIVKSMYQLCILGGCPYLFHCHFFIFTMEDKIVPTSQIFL